MIEDNKWYKYFKERPWLVPVVLVGVVLAIAGISNLIGWIF